MYFSTIEPSYTFTTEDIKNKKVGATDIVVCNFTPMVGEYVGHYHDNKCTLSDYSHITNKNAPSLQSVRVNC